MNPTYVYVGAFVDELQRSGVRHVVICPGSRSTPLAVTIAAQTDIHTWMHVDERSAAFFGLGMAKRLGQPVALLCTSGTAAANFLPAIVEAKLTRVPLLVLTADRPHELRDCGAPQSIDQNRLYGVYAKWFVDVALPEATNTALRSIRTIACRAVALTRAVPAGPVHLNFPFREPLVPVPIAAQALPPEEMRDLSAWEGRPGNAPFVQVHDAPLFLSLPENKAGLSSTTIERLVEMLRPARRGLIVAGPYADPALAEPLVRLAGLLGYPILADPLSQLRCGEHDQTQVLCSYDAFLRVNAFVEKMVPELVLRFGANPTSKSLQLYLQRYASCPLVVIDGLGGWEEPAQLASELVRADPVALCQGLFVELRRATTRIPTATDGDGRPHIGVDEEVRRATARGPTGDHKGPHSAQPHSRPYGTETGGHTSMWIKGSDGRPQASPLHSTPLPPLRVGDDSYADQAWLESWQLAERVTRQTLQATIYDFKENFEGRVFSELGGLLPDGATLYVGNSMPVRDMDTFFWCSERRIRCMGNRGANGIDGVISSALGASAAGTADPVVLVLGDLAFFHDLNGLLAAQLHQLDLTIVLVNNDGGGIFSFLPQAAYPEHFEQLFGTPTGLDFRLAVQMYGGLFQHVEIWEQFRMEVERGLSGKGLHVIEVSTERESNVRLHRELWHAVDRALSAQGIGISGLPTDNTKE